MAKYQDGKVPSIRLPIYPSIVWYSHVNEPLALTCHASSRALPIHKTGPPYTIDMVRNRYGQPKAGRTQEELFVAL